MGSGGVLASFKSFQSLRPKALSVMLAGVVRNTLPCCYQETNRFLSTANKRRRVYIYIVRGVLKKFNMNTNTRNVNCMSNQYRSTQACTQESNSITRLLKADRCNYVTIATSNHDHRHGRRRCYRFRHKFPIMLAVGSLC